MRIEKKVRNLAMRRCATVSRRWGMRSCFVELRLLWDGQMRERDFAEETVSVPQACLVFFQGGE